MLQSERLARFLLVRFRYESTQSLWGCRRVLQTKAMRQLYFDPIVKAGGNRRSERFPPADGYVWLFYQQLQQLLRAGEEGGNFLCFQGLRGHACQVINLLAQ